VPILETRYEEFVKDPVALTKKIFAFAQLPPSKYVDEYLQEMVVSNRNARTSKKTSFSDETKNVFLKLRRHIPSVISIVK
jgi:hypothetical protein